MKSMEPVYKPGAVEARWYSSWLEENLFAPETTQGTTPFTIMIPPPNITGSLHMGHALDNTIQDIMIRFKRMQGYRTLWLPGTDHAGIATQMVVEKELKGQGLTRASLGREKFVERVWEWKKQYGSIIVEQLKKLGVSCDWSRERFTMDERYCVAVRKAFVALYKKGTIYRGGYIINWCPRCTTAVSDLEVQHEEEEGFLYYLSYPLADDSSRGLVIATTRPETILADVAVAVHPSDSRYTHLHGKTVLLPIIGRRLTVVPDDYADPKFGTGAVKITPAHDPNDFLVGKRHSLPALCVMDERGKMNQEAGRYAGLDRYACRKAILADLEEGGYLVKKEPHLHAIGKCHRCNTSIEPMISIQWFARMDSLVVPAIHAVREGKIRFIPERFTKIYLDWMEQIRDWCISRQLWWGHQIPAWYCLRCNSGKFSKKGQTHASDGQGVEEFLFHEDASPLVTTEEPASCPVCGGSELVQDKDVLDTWFSSAIWPFATLGWPEQTADLETYYPTSLLVTARDIIFLWVARMVMIGLEFMGEVPFRDIYIHATVLDKTGRRMSKSLGTGVDPLELIEKYGADSVRFGLIIQAAQGQDVRFSEEKIQMARNFLNKIWNASRLIFSSVDFSSPLAQQWAGLTQGKAHDEKTAFWKGLREDLSFPDQWILSTLHLTVKKITRNLEEYDLAEAALGLFNFFWGDFCDWYLELAKRPLNGQDSRQKEVTGVVLLETLCASLQLMHPFIPLLTEEIWQRFPFGPRPRHSISLEPWPVAPLYPYHQESAEKMEWFMQIVRGVRALRADLAIPPKERVPVIVEGRALTPLLLSHQDLISYLTLASPLTVQEQLPQKPERALSSRIGDAEIFLPVEAVGDVTLEITKLEKELAGIESELQEIELTLHDRNFLEKAKESVITRKNARKEEILARKGKVQQRIFLLKGKGGAF